MTETIEIESDKTAESVRTPGFRRPAAGLMVAVWCVGLSTLAVAPFFWMGRGEGAAARGMRMPVTHDMFLHYDQMTSFYDGLTAGEVYPRWEEDTNRGFGAPTTSFYPPGIYYLTAVCFVITGDWLRALLSAQLLMMIASGAALYAYARQVMGRGAAVAAMTAYIVLPYHLADQYHRGAIAELLGFVWMPLMLLFADQLLRSSRECAARGASGSRSSVAAVAGLALSYGGFLWSHPPTAYQFTLGFSAYVLVIGISGGRWRRLPLVGIAMGLGIGLSAAYLLPAAVEQNLIHKEFISATWPYHKTYIFVHDLYTAASNGGFFVMLNWIWTSGTLVIGGGAALLGLFNRQPGVSSPELRRRVLALVIVGGLASFMMIRASMPVGRLIPMIEIGVFTWRMLSITTLVVAILIGACFQTGFAAAQTGRRSTSSVLVGMGVFLLAGFACFSVVAVARPVAGYSVFEPAPEHLNYATMPAPAPTDPEALPDDVPRAELAGDNGSVAVEEWAPQHRTIRAKLKAGDRLLLRTFNFPGWTATVDGQRAAIETGKELGDMEIALEKGDHLVRVDFLDTPVRRYGRTMTLVSAALLIVLGCAGVASKLRGAGADACSGEGASS